MDALVKTHMVATLSNQQTDDLVVAVHNKVAAHFLQIQCDIRVRMHGIDANLLYLA